MPLNDFQRWRANCCPTLADGKNTEIYGKWLIGDVASDEIGELDAATFQEFGEPMRRMVVSGILSTDRNWHSLGSIELDAETGLGATSNISMETSGDGQRTWSTARTRSMGTGSAQVRVRWNIVGARRQTVFRFIVDNAVKVVLIALHGRVRGRAS
jgi:hypothetical protein